MGRSLSLFALAMSLGQMEVFFHFVITKFSIIFHDNNGFDNDAIFMSKREAVELVLGQLLRP